MVKKWCLPGARGCVTFVRAGTVAGRSKVIADGGIWCCCGVGVVVRRRALRKLVV